MKYFAATFILLALILLTVGCTDTKTVFRESPPFTDPPEGAGGFLGYNDVSEKQTVCGNCHIGYQVRWETSAHADAWEGLQSSGHAASYCEGCHTVGPNGNPEVEGGWAAAPEERYYDVQCENCHGPGLDHVMSPDGSGPLASIEVIGGDMATTCAECHSGAHHPFVEEWEMSPHAEPLSYPAGREYCTPCHTAQGALEAWGVNADYLEKDAPLGEQEGIVCVVCHDPHASDHPGQLRFSLSGRSEETNLCMKCHHKRAEPEVDASTVRGPHSPQGPLLLGEAVGWWPDGFERDDRILSSHGTAGNPRLCATCHVNTTEVTDNETGEFVLNSTGHLFLAIPCTDENGMPLPTSDCPDNERTFEACANGACHLGDPDRARDAWQTVNIRMVDLTAHIF